MITIRLKKGCEKAVLKGQPWVYEGEIIKSSEQLLIPPGMIVDLYTHKDEFIGIGTFNVHTPIVFRMIAKQRVPVDAVFLYNRLKAALDKREKLFKVPFYRLVH